MPRLDWKPDDPELLRTVELWSTANNISEVGRQLGLSRQAVQGRLSAAKRFGIIPTVDAVPSDHPARLNLPIDTGTVLIGSDCHYWTGEPSTAHRAFVRLIKKIKPVAVIMNGDVLDGASISRHAPMQWEERPTLIQEIEACKDRLGEIEKAAGKARRIWTLGNHDARYESKLANMVPEYAHVHGMHLKDNFPLWEPTMSVWINGHTVVKHRFKGGIHAAHNNALWSGKSMVTGHLHSLKVTPFSDYNGTRFGCDCGTMATPYGPQFDYTEDNPVNWRSGFLVLSFVEYRLMWPEIVHVIEDGKVEWRGEIIEV